MATTKFYLDLRGKSKDGKGSVIIILNHNYTSTTFPTDVRLSPSEWDSKKQIVIKSPSAAALNALLKDTKNKLDKAIAVLSLRNDFEFMSAAQIKKEISGNRQPNQKHLVTELFDEYIKANALKDSTREIYLNAKKKVKDFSENTCVEDIGYLWINTFDQHLAQTQTINGRSVYLRALRAVCKYAERRGIIASNPFSEYHIKSETTRKRSVSVELLRKLRSAQTTKKNEKYRDYFFLMFYLIGINAKDLLLAEKSQVVDGRLEYTREKTRKKYSIKIEPEAAELLSKYKGHGDYLLEAMDHCEHYKSYAREINEALKTIKDDNGDPIIPDITTYYARHCWATYAYEKEIPIDIISQALGHSFGNRTTLVYVKYDQKKVDEANRKVIDYLLKP